MTYRSTTVISKNEDNNPEVVLEYERTLLDWLFRLPAKKETFEFGDGGWRRKGYSTPLSPKKIYEIMRIVKWHRHMDSEMKRMFQK
jgi:hypothetical protein